MAEFETSYESSIIKDYYGDVVHRVAKVILQYGKLPLFRIIQDTQLPKDEVVAALLVLFQHNFMQRDPEVEEEQVIPTTYQQALMDANEKKREGKQKPKLINYEINNQAVLRRARASKYLHIAKTLFGDGGYAIAFQIIIKGILPYSQVIKGALDYLSVHSDSSLIDGYKLELTFRQMCSRKFLRQIHAKEHLSIIKEPVQFSFDPPLQFLYSENGSASTSTTELTATGKRRRENDDKEELHTSKYRIDDSGDAIVVNPFAEETFWVLHADRFHLHIRNKLLSEFCGRKFLPCSENIVFTVLSASENDDHLGNDISAHVQDTVLATKSSTPESEKLYRKYAIEELLSEYILIKGMGGTVVSVNVKALKFLLIKETLEQIVMERYGTYSARLFRFLLDKGYLEQKQLHDLGMIPLKDARERSNTLMTTNLVSLQELPKSGERVPSRTAFAWTVKLPQAVDVIRKELYHILSNIKLKREAELSLVTPSQNGIRRLDIAEIRLDDLFLIFTEFDETRLPLDLPDISAKKPRGKK